MAPSSRPMTRAFRKRMLQQAALLLVALVAILLILVMTLGEKAFLIAALILCPLTALGFNFLMRRNYAAQQKNSIRR